MGDPETEVVLPRLKTDLVMALQNCAQGTLGRVKIRADKRAATTVFLVSGGYPGDYTKGKPITGLDKIKGSLAFHAGMRNASGAVVTDGGRVLAITSFGKDLAAALKKSNRNAKLVQFEGKFFRKDIGKDVQKLADSTKS
jgi:phosphoribosylamine--glycine ligase